MADLQAVQTQLSEFIALYKANKEVLTTRLEELSLHVSTQHSAPDRSNNDSRNSMDSRAKGPRSGGGRGDQKFFPKPTRLDLPRFNGNADPLSWITHWEQLFRHRNTLDTDFLSSFLPPRRRCSALVLETYCRLP